MQAIFSDILAGDLASVRERVAQDPDSVALVARGDHDGHSPLMVALLAGDFAIADFLLDHGADTDYIDASNSDVYARPVLHDAITAAVLRTLPPSRGAEDDAAASFTFLRRLLDRGADMNAVDSQGNSSLFRAASDAWAVLQCASLDQQVDATLNANLLRIFTLLVSFGADPYRRDARTGASVSQMYRGHAVGALLTDAARTAGLLASSGSGRGQHARSAL